MNTNLLKSFAQQTRLRLIKSVTDKLKYVLSSDSAILRDYATSIDKLKKDIIQIGEESLIDKVAYTWFNRLMALRFMDANDYQPLQIKIISPVEGYTQPEILNEATQGRIHEDLKIDRQKINDLLDGRISVAIPENEVYRMLLIASCNHLSNLFPFLFEKIDDYTELLLPDDLTSELSIINDFINGMTKEDCEHTELIGWLYQFYISEKKDEVFAKKEKVEKEEIPAATQLFTPRWIVEYMVQNTVGKLWMQNNPNSSLRDKMLYYIETESSKSDEFIKINSPEDITLLDQACGSGHILVYGFELLYHIYEEAGYSASQIPQLIIDKNLFGYEIDERASQLASFSLLMKARSYYRRLFRDNIEPNILCYKDLTLSNDEIKSLFIDLKLNLSVNMQYDLQCMQQATNLGSLIQPQSSIDELHNLYSQLNDLRTSQNIFIQQSIDSIYNAVEQLIQVRKKYCCVVQNPPYMGGGKMNKELTDFVKKEYPDSKADLFSCFIDRSINTSLPNGIIGNVTMESWMFLSSFEKFRKDLLENVTIDSLSHFGWHIMRIAFGTVSFILRNKKPNGSDLGVYNYLEIDDIEKEIEKPLVFPNKERRYAVKNQKDFNKVPGSPICYWVTNNIINAFSAGVIGDNCEVREGVGTRNDNRFLRLFWEVEIDKLSVDNKWLKTDKAGGGFKWYNQYMHILNWGNNGYEIRNYRNPDGSLKSRPQNTQFFYKEAISWGKVSSGERYFRFREKDFGFNDAAPSIFGDQIIYILGLLNSKVAGSLIEIKGETLNLTVGVIKELPLLLKLQDEVNSIVCSNIENSKQFWLTNELSWDFYKNDLIILINSDQLQKTTIDLAINLYKQYWTKKFYNIHSNEEILNVKFIELYGLQNDLTPDVRIDDITILRDELNQRELKELGEEYKSGWELVDNKWELSNQKPLPVLPFNEKDIIMQFISYAVGCMFGRYSLDKEGVILANQGETLENFISKIGKDIEKINFTPDEDNIIPVLEGEWFEDDIASRVSEFVKVVFGVESHQANIDYIEKALGKSLRAYMYRDFYTDHIKRYKKRPIYWMISSPIGSFQALIYMHRYNEDTISNVLNYYLRPYIDKLESHIEFLNHLVVEGTQREKTKSTKDIVRVEKVIDELRTYDKDVLYPLALERISIDLDDGVLVNYNKFGGVLKTVAGLNDAVAKRKVKKFDWIDVSEIR